MNIALMNIRIIFQKNSVITDAIGNHRNAWEDHFSCHATINGERGSENETAGQTVSNGRCAFTVRWCRETAAVTETEYRIRCGDDLYNITSIDHQNNKRKSLKFWVQKVRR